MGKWNLGVGTLRQWHWISSAVCLVAMLGFSITGITLNRASIIPADIERTSIEGVLPEAVFEQLDTPPAADAPAPSALKSWLRKEHGISVSGIAEWYDDELYIAMARPGADAWLSVDLETGEFLFEETDRGWVAFFNDLHKGRDSGTAWRWFIDAVAVACIVFCVTGLLLLQRHAAQRPSTWPVVGLGLLVPFILILLFVH